MKTCSRCLKDRNDALFCLDVDDKPVGYCRLCRLEYQRQWRAANPERVRAHRETEKANRRRQRARVDAGAR